jgi:AcrR family transcriptional regulator
VKAKTKKTDLRIIRTRQRLTNSLRELIVEKGYEHITVKDVLSRAKVGRSTFYAHFESIDHLLPCEDNFREMLSQPVPLNGNSPIKINFLALYQHVAENQSLAKAVLDSRGGPIVTGHLKNVLTSMIREQAPRPVDPMLLLVTEATASALVTLLVEWYRQEMPFSAAMMAVKSTTLIRQMCGEYL